MKKSAVLPCILLFFGAAAPAATPAATAPVGEVIARARACLGGEAALRAVHSVHFSGTIESQKATAAGLVPQTAHIEILFQKPYQQRIVVTGAENVETTGLDGYTAWQREQSLKDPMLGTTNLLAPDSIKWLRATAWENLNFYQGIEDQGGSIEVVGDTDFEGRAAVKVSIAPAPGVVFYHFFDRATGKLLFTEAKDRTTREEGEILVDGVRFPQKEVQIVKALDAKGKPVERKLVITFEKITLNETFPDSDFEIPVAPRPGAAPAVRPPAPTPAAAPAAAK